MRRQLRERKLLILRILEDKGLLSTLAPTEWIFPGQRSGTVMQLFDQLTAYGEFHGDGNTAYTPFKRDSQS